MSFAVETPVKAVRKAYHCDGCNRQITVGSPATRWAGLTEGDFGTAIYHPECREAEVAYNREAGWQWGDDWYPLSEIEPEDRPWLAAEYPLAAQRLGIAPTSADASLAVVGEGAASDTPRKAE